MCVRTLAHASSQRRSHVRERLEHFDRQAPETHKLPQERGSRGAARLESAPPLVSEYVFPTGGTPVTLERFAALRSRYMRLKRRWLWNCH